MKALHINSTLPFQGAEFFIEDPIILCTILSALMWRKLNGEIKLYTDKVGYDYYKRVGLLGLYDGGIDVDTLEHLPSTIDYRIFWAGAKLFALRKERTPIAMIDNDLVVWKPIGSEFASHPVTVLHTENLDEQVYPSGYVLLTRNGYQYNPAWDWNARPCNTALACFSDPAFLEYYIGCAVDFMEGNAAPAHENVSRMVFAEQRILAMCAAEKGIAVHTLLGDPFERQDLVTHIWGAKVYARNDPEQNRILCNFLLQCILRHFPDFSFGTPKLQSLLETYK